MTSENPALPPRRFQWPGSISLNLSLSAVIGLAYSLYLVGTAPLNPLNISWMVGDPACYYIGWTALRRESSFHWPLTFTTNVGYPHGTEVAFFDLNPLFAVLLKPFSPLLPDHFQWFGPLIVGNCALQFFFGTLLARYFLGRNAWGIVLAGLFFLTAPIFIWRQCAHFALGSHWILLASFLLFLKLQDEGAQAPFKFMLWLALLQGIAVGTNPYIGFMAALILNSAVLFARWTRKLSWRDSGLCVAALWCSFASVAVALGYARPSGGLSGTGYRVWALNLLAPINPGRFGSAFLPSFSFGGFAHYEAYAYFGLGFLLLTAALLPRFFRLLSARHENHGKVRACVAWCLAITLFAASTRITAGPWIVADLDPHQQFTKYLAVFRGSGRFFWMPYYIILLTVLVTAFKVWKPKTAITLVSLALALQVIDEQPVQAFVRDTIYQRHDSPFHAPIWSKLGKNHQNFMVEPPWQCGPEVSPANDLYSFGPFGILALDNHLRTNSYYSARYSDAELAYDCNSALKPFLRTPLARDSVYVVSPAIAAAIAAGPTGTDACHPVDGLILCAADRSLSPLGSVPDPPLLPSSNTLPPWSDPSIPKFLPFGWSSAEPWGVWTTGDSLLRFTLSPQQEQTFHFLLLQLQLLIGAQPVRYEVTLDGKTVSGSLAGNPTPRLEKFASQLAITPSPRGVHNLLLHTINPVQPNAIHFAKDNRSIGLGLSSLTLER